MTDTATPTPEAADEPTSAASLVPRWPLRNISDPAMWEVDDA